MAQLLNLTVELNGIEGIDEFQVAEFEEGGELFAPWNEMRINVNYDMSDAQDTFSGYSMIANSYKQLKQPKRDRLLFEMPRGLSSQAQKHYDAFRMWLGTIQQRYDNGFCCGVTAEEGIFERQLLEDIGVDFNIERYEEEASASREGRATDLLQKRAAGGNRRRKGNAAAASLGVGNLFG